MMNMTKYEYDLNDELVVTCICNYHVCMHVCISQRCKNVLCRNPKVHSLLILDRMMLPVT
jgi:hypothetical protein